ncbi:type VI secretion system baseplate subunit TssK, partial [Pseudomonas viridiflava]
AYVKLKLCQVLVSTPDKAIRLDAGFVPSFINAGGSAYLMSCLKEVVSLLENRGNAIAGRIRSNGQTGSAEVGDFMMLQLINRTELVLRHYLTLQDVHPEPLYRALLALLGELSTFGAESKRPLLDSQYQHSDQGATFGKVMIAIRQVLSMVLE